MKTKQQIQLELIRQQNQNQQLFGFADVPVKPLFQQEGEGGGSGESTQPEAGSNSELEAKVKGLEELVDKFRAYEKDWKKDKNRLQDYEKALGEVDPDKLESLKQAQIELEKEKQLRQQQEVEIRNQVNEERNEEVKTWQDKYNASQAKNEALELRGEVLTQFLEYGDVSKFDTFMLIMQNNLVRQEDGTIQIKDDRGKIVTVKVDGQERFAHPNDFIEMISKRQLKNEDYYFTHLAALVTCTQAYNKSTVDFMNSGNGAKTTKKIDTKGMDTLQMFQVGLQD